MRISVLLTAIAYGRYNIFGPLTLTFSNLPGRMFSYMRRTQSHKIGLVCLGSMISGISKFSAVRTGERTASN